jgi:5-methyltetrahydrofolate--homocysteine methyltransferase
MPLLDEIAEVVQKGRAKDVVRLVREALDSGVDAIEVLDGGLLRGMRELGAKFRKNEVFVPEVLLAARALNQGSEVLRGEFVKTGAAPIGKAVLATVEGDQHDIGKNLVRMMMEGAGIAVIDLGVDVPDERIVEAVRIYEPDILALSALLTTTMDRQADVIRALGKAGLRDGVKVMVGGAPVTQRFCDEIAADIYTPDAAAAAVAARECLRLGGSAGKTAGEESQLLV